MCCVVLLCTSWLFFLVYINVYSIDIDFLIKILSLNDRLYLESHKPTMHCMEHSPIDFFILTELYCFCIYNIYLMNIILWTSILKIPSICLFGLTDDDRYHEQLFVNKLKMDNYIWQKIKVIFYNSIFICLSQDDVVF